MFLPDPHGHAGDASKIERIWAQMAAPGQVTRSRALTFDSEAALTYAPVTYRVSPFGANWPTAPNDDWIGEAFSNFVRGEFRGKTRADSPASWRPTVERDIGLPRHHLTDLLRTSERVIRAGAVDTPRGLPSPEDMGRAIFRFLCHPSVGSRKNQDNNDEASFVSRVTPQIRGKDRLMFVLPGFPFKDQNRFRVPHSASHPDLSDVAFMIRLHLLTQAIYQVHPYGADVVIFSDGHLYSNIFGVPGPEVDSYMRRLKWYRNELNLQGTVSFLDLKKVIDSAPCGTDGRPITHQVRDQIEGRLRALVGSAPQVTEAMDVLIRGMKWNLNSRTNLVDLDDAECWAAIRESRPDREGAFRLRWDEVHAQATEAAFQYASTNLMIKHLDVIERVFPGSIRATVHPKEKQFALAGSGGLYAWNGVAWTEGALESIASIKVLPFYSLVDRGPLERVVLEPDGYPLYFRRARHD